MTVWSREQHERAIADPDQAHLWSATAPRRWGSFSCAASRARTGTSSSAASSSPTRGRGLGREVLALVLDNAFGELGAHRVWLDVKPHNERALGAYRAVGFVHEGVLRDALLTEGEWESLAIMSVLEHEWSERR